MAELTFKNKYTTNPSDVKPLDAFAIKVMAWVHVTGQSWAAYYGPSDWSDERIAEQGDELPEKIARGIFHVLNPLDMLYGDM